CTILLAPPVLENTLPAEPKLWSRPLCGGGVTQLTWMLVTLAAAIVPLLLVKEQFCTGLAGCAAMLTDHAVPSVSNAGKVNDPFAGICTWSKAFVRKVSPVPARPDTVPPSE